MLGFSLDPITAETQSAQAAAAPDMIYDVVIYGDTPAAVTAAIQADRMGMRVALVSPGRHLGGMTSSGLGWTDSKDGKAIGGLAREFYHRIWEHYRAPEAWTRGDRASYAAGRVRAQPGPTIDDKAEAMWTFEPHVAEKIFDAWLAGTGVDVHRDEWLDRKSGVTVADHRIRQIRTLSGRTYAGHVFIDATYEGDLMAAADVTYRIGRDAAKEWDEPLNGIYFKKPEPNNNAYVLERISPYIVPDDPGSGLIAGIEGVMPAGEHAGDADTRLQSFNLRLCLTAVPENRVPIERPANYREADYELLLRAYEAGHPSGFSTEEMPNGKTDSNNSGIMSLDLPGGNFSIAEGWNYSEADYDQRRKIVEAHRQYTQGLLWTIMHHPRVPESERLRWSRYGLAADEFADNGHWPRQLYVREARRMMGLSVMTQHHVQRRDPVADSIGLGSYSLDSHVVRRVVVDGKLRNEGGFYVWWTNPYPISYGAIVPRREEVRNLLVPVTLSATHAAFGSIRMEPTYMILGQAAGTAASLAVKGRLAVQDVPYSALRSRLAADGQVLDPPPLRP